ncbi:putative rRNA methylase [Candidatus Promineifilum breve]|uniref:rRNA methylase n=1 Tax=Candidatus Promineifilum breve TaxID=1806508 RepID=A0A160T0U6_9CHLR|nr:TrmH family RNA methyltransferase [Candidatus Promineifilum breve]CUS03591.2 putative rRNA methylase [Candidatus Promineifilum breve]
MITITSTQNPHVKNVIKLNDRRARDEARRTVVEGAREVGLALGRGVVPVEAFICPELIDGPAAETAARHLVTIGQTGMSEVFYVSPEVFAKMAYRGGSGGLLLVVAYRPARLDDIQIRGVPFLVIVEEAEKPGNLGAVLRTADAAGVDAVIVPIPPGSRGTDLHNPNVIRASLGAYFTVPAVAAPSDEAIAWLRAHDIAIVAATPAAETLYTAADLSGRVAVAVGSEAWGLGEAWLAAADVRVRIPMSGQVDSLNLSASAALLMYEVVRQRGGAGEQGGRGAGEIDS